MTQIVKVTLLNFTNLHFFKPWGICLVFPFHACLLSKTNNMISISCYNEFIVNYLKRRLTS